MSLFDLFGGKSEASQLKKLAERVANKRSQPPDRWEAITALAKLKTPDAVSAILPRFTFYVEPSIVDQDEKDAAFEAVVAMGSAAVPPVVAFLERTDSISWPMKMLERIAGAEVVIERLLELLSRMDTEYERDPQKKIQVLVELEERADPRVASAVERFIADANETVRFHAVSTLLAQPAAEDYREPLAQRIADEESVRIRMRLLEAFATRQWAVGEAAVAVRTRLPAGFALNAQGVPQKR